MIQSLLSFPYMVEGQRVVLMTSVPFRIKLMSMYINDLFRNHYPVSSVSWSTVNRLLHLSDMPELKDIIIRNYTDFFNLTRMDVILKADASLTYMGSDLREHIVPYSEIAQMVKTKDLLDKQHNTGLGLAAAIQR